MLFSLTFLIKLSFFLGISKNIAKFAFINKVYSVHE